MKKLNSKGSSPLHIVLILVIVGLISGVGYYVYSSQKKTNTALDNAANSQSNPQKVDKNEDTAKPVNTFVDGPNNKSSAVVVVSEARLEFTVPAGYPTVVYKELSADNYELYVQGKVEENMACQDTSTGSIGTLTALTKGDYEKLGTDPNDYGVLVDDKYWFVSRPGGCGVNPDYPRINMLLETISKSIKEN